MYWIGKLWFLAVLGPPTYYLHKGFKVHLKCLCVKAAKMSFSWDINGIFVPPSWNKGKTALPNMPCMAIQSTPLGGLALLANDNFFVFVFNCTIPSRQPNHWLRKEQDWQSQSAVVGHHILVVTAISDSEHFSYWWRLCRHLDLLGTTLNPFTFEQAHLNGFLCYKFCCIFFFLIIKNI